MAKENFTYKYDDLFNPLLTALHHLGGSGSVGELENEVASILQLNERQVNEIHRGNITKLSYRLAWARNYLKHYGLLENSSRGVWALTKEGLKTKAVDEEQVKRQVVSEDRKKRQTSNGIHGINDDASENDTGNEEIEDFTWQQECIEVMRQISASAFERLCQRVLRELGFVNVEVTGKSNDGGIDGKGLLRLGGVLSFHVLFQAKRFKGSVTPSIVRDFRGAMVGRADKGLIITTGTYTRSARLEAQRDGATPIDLIDGNDLAEKLKELGLGIGIETVERVTVRKDWFKAL